MFFFLTWRWLPAEFSAEFMMCSLLENTVPRTGYTGSTGDSSNPPWGIPIHGLARRHMRTRERLNWTSSDIIYIVRLSCCSILYFIWFSAMDYDGMLLSSRDICRVPCNQTWQPEIPFKWRCEWEIHSTHVFQQARFYITLKTRWCSACTRATW